MALLCNNNYYKLDFSNFRVVDGNLFIKCIIYKEQKCRDLEKQNAEAIIAFKQNVLAYLQKLELEFMSKVKEIDAGATLTDELIATMEASNSDLKQLHLTAQTLRSDYDAVLKNISGECCDISNVSLLKELGMQESWLACPIVIQGEVEVNVGPASGEEITAQNFYNKLKKIILDTQDC